MGADIQHRDARKLLDQLRRRRHGQQFLTYETAAVAIGRKKKDARAVAQMCDLLDAAAVLAGLPPMALVMVRQKDGQINQKAWRGDHPRDAIVGRSLAHRFTDEDFVAIRNALRALHSLGNHAAWKEVRSRLSRADLYETLTGSPLPSASRRPAEALADEIVDYEHLTEGARKTIVVNAYERSRKARRRCIAHWGCRCVVCGFDFWERYGDMGQGFIHVHHIKPLSDIGQAYVLDPVADLRPVCPNCHAMLHSGDSVLGIEELQRVVFARRHHHIT